MNTTIRRALLTAASLSLLAATSVAQGGDHCSGPQVIVGTGQFGFNTLASTSGGPEESIWSIPGRADLHNDVWFAWQAPSTSVYEISTCFPSTNQEATCVAVYEFGCTMDNGRAIEARGGYDCGHFSILELGTKAGTTYLIRIGHMNSMGRISGIFEISEVSPPSILGSAVNPGNGRTYHLLEPSSWSVAQAAAVTLGGNLVTVNDQAENDWLHTTFLNWGGQPRSFWLGYNDAEIEGVWTWVSGENPGFENWGGGAPNNGYQYEHYAHARHDWSDGTWNDLVGFPRVGFFYSTVYGVVEINDPALCSWYCGSGGNMDTYVVNSGFKLGGTFQGTVGISTPNVGAVVAGYLGQATFPVWGQEGLVDVTTPEVMGMPSALWGPSVSITWSVPNEPAYSGFQVFTQAAGFGGGSINLTCAFDCLVGY